MDHCVSDWSDMLTTGAAVISLRGAAKWLIGCRWTGKTAARSVRLVSDIDRAAGTGHLLRCGNKYTVCITTQGVGLFW
jgi:hypothetical protein